LRKIEYVMAI